MSDEFEIVPLRSSGPEKPDAADWLAKLDRGDLSAQEREGLVRWLAEDPKNKLALRRTAALWYGLNDQLGALGKTPHKPAAKPPRLTLGSAVVAATVRYKGLALAAAVACGAFIFFRPTATDHFRPTTNYFATVVGETRVISLEDGSRIDLNTNSRVEQSFSRNERVVRLLSGEAIFEVVHNPSRPFIVYAADGVIRDIGTKFSVRVEPDDVRIMVMDGQIAVKTRSDESAEPIAGNHTGTQLAAAIMVGKGEAAEIDQTHGAKKEAISRREVQDRLSWTEGKLAFHDKAVQLVVDEVARYTTVHIVVAGEPLKTRKITGILPIGNVNEMLEGMEGALGVKAKWLAPNVVQLSAG